MGAYFGLVFVSCLHRKNEPFLNKKSEQFLHAVPKKQHNWFFFWFNSEIFQLSKVPCLTQKYGSTTHWASTMVQFATTFILERHSAFILRKLHMSVQWHTEVASVSYWTTLGLSDSCSSTLGLKWAANESVADLVVDAEELLHPILKRTSLYVLASISEFVDHFRIGVFSLPLVGSYFRTGVADFRFDVAEFVDACDGERNGRRQLQGRRGRERGGGRRETRQDAQLRPRASQGLQRTCTCTHCTFALLLVLIHGL